MKILDVGCGSGIYQDITTQRGEVNFDIEKPKHKIKRFVLGNAEILPFKNNSFEKSLFIDVIEHVNNPCYCLKELKRVTKHKIIVGTPNAIWLPKILRCFTKGNYEVYSDHIATYGIPELSQLFDRVGFKNYTIKTSNYRMDNLNKIHYTIIKLFPKALQGRQILAEIKLMEK